MRPRRSASPMSQPGLRSKVPQNELRSRQPLRTSAKRMSLPPMLKVTRFQRSRPKRVRASPIWSSNSPVTAPVQATSAIRDRPRSPCTDRNAPTDQVVASVPSPVARRQSRPWVANPEPSASRAGVPGIPSPDEYESPSASQAAPSPSCAPATDGRTEPADTTTAKQRQLCSRRRAISLTQFVESNVDRFDSLGEFGCPIIRGLAVDATGERDAKRSALGVERVAKNRIGESTNPREHLICASVAIKCLGFLPASLRGQLRPRQSLGSLVHYQ